MSSNVSESQRQEIINKVRDKCLKKSCGALKQLGCVFRRMDIDFSKKICFEELKEGVRIYGIDVTDEELRILFDTFDKDGNDYIDFNEFMNALKPPMSPARVSVIDEAFDKLDVNGDGVLKLEDLKVVYKKNVQRHPKFLSGEWTEEQTLQYFLDSLDTPGSPDGMVTREEFHHYYAGVSATVDDDCYFDLMMRSCYGLYK
ncbi:calcyphosin-like protein [Babylonia areolata]|uniref:calcyphosin-like protein n=1 Tax=Babylonia areolata TaxID=304850 RepID=UPI003FD16BC9